jgi:hypothetical protein
MAAIESRLETSESFGNVAITTPHTRRKYHFPPSRLLNLLDGLFADIKPGLPIELEDPSGDFVVTNYRPNAQYKNGLVTYLPTLKLAESESETELRDRVRLYIGIAAASIRVYSTTPHKMFNRLDPASDKQWSYQLEGATWTPASSVAERMVEHDTLVRFGQCLVDRMQTVEIDNKNFEDYRALKLIDT